MSEKKQPRALRGRDEMSQSSSSDETSQSSEETLLAGPPLNANQFSEKAPAKAPEPIPGTSRQAQEPVPPLSLPSDCDSDEFSQVLKEIYKFDVFEDGNVIRTPFESPLPTAVETARSQESSREEEEISEDQDEETLREQVREKKQPLPVTYSAASTSSDVDTLSALGELSELQISSSRESMTTTTPRQPSSTPPSFNLYDFSLDPTQQAYFINKYYPFGEGTPYPSITASLNNDYGEMPEPQGVVPPNVTKVDFKPTKYLNYQVGSRYSLNPQQTVYCTMAPMFCDYCFKNNEAPHIYNSHFVHDRDGNISCLRLWNYVCKICGGTGINAHVEEECPLRNRAGH